MKSSNIIINYLQNFWYLITLYISILKVWLTTIQLVIVYLNKLHYSLKHVLTQYIHNI